jgi:hypothetical protein
MQILMLIFQLVFSPVLLLVLDSMFHQSLSEYYVLVQLLVKSFLLLAINGRNSIKFLNRSDLHFFLHASVSMLNDVYC